MALIDFEELQKVLADLAKDVREGYKDTLERNDRIASSELINSVKTQVEIGDSAYEVTMTLTDYWKYVEYDTKPHWPPSSAIIKWIQVKPIIPRPDSKGRIPTPKQLAFLIGRAMAGLSPNQPNLKNPNGGTTGTHDLEKTKDAVIPMYKERIEKALGRDIEHYIRKIVPEELKA